MRLVMLLMPLIVLLAVACGGDEEAPVPTATASPAPRTATPEAAAGTLAFVRDGDVWLIDVSGSSERRLGLKDVQSLSWVSRDELDVVIGADSSGHLLVDLEGNAEPLSFPAGGSWTRDGARYVVPVDQQVVVFDREGMERARLDVEPPVETGEKARQCGAGGQADRLVFSRPIFAPDGQRIIVSVNCMSRAGATGNLYAPVYELSIADGTQRALALETNLEDGPPASFSPDGGRVAQPVRYGGSACASDYYLWVQNAAAAEAPRAVTVQALAARTPQPHEEVLGGIIGYDWSPEGDAVVVSVNASVCRRLDVEPYVRIDPLAAGLYILKLDDSPEEKLVDGPTRSPAWSPSGQYIAYVAQGYFGEEIGPPLLRVLDLTTRQSVEIGPGAQPAWQPQP